MGDEMCDAENQWVPKVHPLDRDAAPEDPMELFATPVHGDPDVMLQCMLEEFAWMGMDGDALVQMCRHPNYPVLNQLWDHFGEAEVRARIEALVARTRLVQFHEIMSETADEDLEDEEPPLIQLSLTKLALA